MENITKKWLYNYKIPNESQEIIAINDTRRQTSFSAKKTALADSRAETKPLTPK